MISSEGKSLPEGLFPASTNPSDLMRLIVKEERGKKQGPSLKKGGWEGLPGNLSLRKQRGCQQHHAERGRRGKQSRPPPVFCKEKKNRLGGRFRRQGRQRDRRKAVRGSKEK